jgi:hypothetical protein
MVQEVNILMPEGFDWRRWAFNAQMTSAIMLTVSL